MFFDLPSDPSKKKATRKKTAKKKATKKAPVRKKVAKKATRKKATKKKVVKKKVAKKVTRKAVSRKKAPVRKKARRAAQAKAAKAHGFIPSEWRDVPKHDLYAVMDILNATYFTKLKALGKKPAPVDEVKWGRVAKRQFGVCRHNWNTGRTRITINGQLRGPEVPTYVMAFTLYHEMVHAYCFNTGEKICKNHNRQFRERERLFVGWEEVKAWRMQHFLGYGNVDDCTFSIDQRVHLRGSPDTWTVVGCKGAYVLVKKAGSKEVWKAHANELVAANPARLTPVLPELEDDIEIVGRR